MSILFCALILKLLHSLLQLLYYLNALTVEHEMLHFFFQTHTLTNHFLLDIDLHFQDLSSQLSNTQTAHTTAHRNLSTVRTQKATKEQEAELVSIWISKNNHNSILCYTSTVDSSSSSCFYLVSLWTHVSVSVHVSMFSLSPGPYTELLVFWPCFFPLRLLITL